jgi:tetratricopeptide (TPR) repeat protein
MASSFENKDRRIVPNFRPLMITAELGELNDTRNIEQIKKTFPLQFVEEDWQNNKTTIHAAELIGTSIMAGEFSFQSAKDAADFILQNTSKATEAQISLARYFHFQSSQTDSSTLSLDRFIDENKQHKLYVEISLLKKLSYKFPHNPFYYTELARLYALIGHEDKAIKYMRVAFSLAPSNRYIIRCYARLLLHFKKPEEAHSMVKKTALIKVDPWIVATEISISSILKKNSNLIKRGMEFIDSKNHSPFSITELSGSIGTVEFLAGSNKKSKSYFLKSLIAPNDNSLAQAEWINLKENMFELSPDKFEIDNSYEALAFEYREKEDWEKAVDNAERWFLDSPLSRRAAIFASHVSNIFLGDFDRSAKFCEAGLISSPNDAQLINNLSYALFLQNKTTEGFEQLNKIDLYSVNENALKVCLLATSGLGYFRSGLIELGRESYIKAIEGATMMKNDYLVKMAKLNLAREEIIAQTELADSFYLKEIKPLPKDEENKEIHAMKTSIEKLIEENKS